ncbi:MAG: hypothetical protein WCP96_07765 [Methylococcaceae bacterium]
MLDEVATENLARILTPALAHWFSNSDSSLWLIRQLDVELDVSADGGQEQLARAWAVQITRSMAITIQCGSDGENVFWFPNRAAYLARFLVDVANGMAWGKWQYESFEGLKPLSVSAILRTVVCGQPETGEEALRQLSETELKKLLRGLTETDACQILDCLAMDSEGSDEFELFEAVWAALRASAFESFNFGGEWQNALRLYLASSQSTGGGIKLKTAVLALLRLTNLLMDGSDIQKEGLVEILARGKVAALYATAGAANAECLVPLLRCPSDWISAVGLALTASVTGYPPANAEELPALRFTPFGGIFLLFPSLDEWPLTKATQGWPDCEEIPASAILRLLILAKCCGQCQIQRVFHDNLIRDLLVIPRDFSIEVLNQWQKDISVCQCRTFLGVLTAWLFQRRAIYGDKLILCHSNSEAVLLDAARGIWLAVEEFSPSCPKGLPEALHLWMERVVPKEKSIESSKAVPEFPMLLCDPKIFIHAKSSCPDACVLSYDDERIKPIVEEDAVLGEILARLGKLPDDLVYLSSPKSWGLASGFDHTLSVAAQSLMRSFAWRLPGFAHSNLPYLYGNFLDFSASLEDEPDRRVVRMGRPPLHLILNMTGIVRGTYRLNWLDERPFALFPEQ